MKIRLPLLIASLATLPLTLPATETVAPPHRVVAIVFDGMRPDFITPETTPNLWKLSREGVFFEHHHAVYLSSTEVNGTAIATGSYPGHSSIIANTDYRPRIDAQKAVNTQDPEVICKGDELSDGHYLGAPTVAEILKQHGLATAIAGTKNVALLHDRLPKPEGPGVSPIVHEGKGRPASINAALAKNLGEIPANAKGGGKIPHDGWTTQALLGTLWENGPPPYSLLWLGEPDASQHACAPGAEEALAAIKSSDDQLGLVLAELDKRQLRSTTDVIVVSDHGFSTISRKVDVAVQLTLAGFQAKRAAPGGLKKGEVLVVGNGGSSVFYIGEQDAGVRTRLIAYLQQQNWTGVIFAKEPAEGTFPLTEAHIDTPEAPDLVVSYQWSPAKSTTGTPGLHTSDIAENSPRKGAHASLSPYDMHATLVAAGPDFRAGAVDTLPSANTDLAPTILWILGLKDEAAKMDGRVLGEALTSAGPALKSYVIDRLVARRTSATFSWRQYLQISEVNGVRYLDEGGGETVSSHVTP